MDDVRKTGSGIILWSALFLRTLCSCAVFADGALTVPPFPLVRTYNLSAEEDWHAITLDSAHHRLYAVRNSAIIAFDLRSGKMVGQIDGLASPDLLAIDAKGNRGFVADYASQSITVLDLKSMKKERVLKAGQSPGRMAYDPVTKRLLVTNPNTHTASIIDPDTDKSLASISLPGEPEDLVGDGHGHVYVTLIDTNAIAAVDVKSVTVTGNWPLDSAIQPLDVAVDAKTHRLFCLCVYGKSVVIDTETGKAVSTLTTPQTASAHCAYDGEAHSIFVVDTAPGQLFAFGPSTGKAPQTIPIAETTPSTSARSASGEYAPTVSVPFPDGARAMAVDPKTHHVFILTGHLLISNPDLYDGPRPTRFYTPGSMTVQEYAPSGQH